LYTSKCAPSELVCVSSDISWPPTIKAIDENSKDVEAPIEIDFKSFAYALPNNWRCGQEHSKLSRVSGRSEGVGGHVNDGDGDDEGRGTKIVD